MAELPPIVESDQQLRAIVAAQLEPGALLAALAHLTGDLELLPDELRLDPDRILEPFGGWTPEQIELATDLATEVLGRFRDEGTPLSPPRGDKTDAIICWLTGTDLDGSYRELLTEELALNGADERAPDWTFDDIDAAAPKVLVIGAGMSGILAAHRLRQIGAEVVIVDKNDAVGGTWLENTYPGCRVDVANHTYCYSFVQKADWPHYHSEQASLLEYFQDCARRWGLADDIRFGTEVVEARWLDAEARWDVAVRGSDGDETLRVDAVVSAVGQLNRPRHPDIAGIDDFAGESFHSARWRHDIDLTGKRVVIIGTGASATQFIPHVAEVASHLTIFQRTPNWLIPRPEYQQRLPDELLWAFSRLPSYVNWFRLRLFWRGHESLLPRMIVDHEWDGPTERSVSAGNDELRELLTLYLQAEFADRPDLLERLVPDYPPGAKRIVLDDGVFARTLKRDDVSLVTDAIERITPTGVVAGGAQIDADVIVYGTGFAASDFLTPMRVTGRDGVDLHAMWAGNATAYNGVTVPGFPNLYLLYGPNTNIVVNGSIIYFSECEAHYVTECLRMLAENGAAAHDVRGDVHDAYNTRIDDGNAAMAWGVSGVNTWYKNAQGRITQNWPFSLVEFWEQTRAADPNDYELLRRDPV